MDGQDRNENLPNDEKGATITPDDSAKPAAGAETPEDTTGFEKVIERQNATIETLLKQVDSLNDQIARYVRNTSTPASDEGSANPASIIEYESPTDEEGYVYLKDLGREIGKR